METKMVRLDELARLDESGVMAVEGAPGQSFLHTIDDSRRIIEACYEHNVGAALLYAENMPEGFFDLSSRQAGEILQKLRNYRIRLAIVCSRDSPIVFSSRFGEMVSEEQKGRDFGIFDTRESALEWLRME